jgi:hypothetical protein
MPLEIRMVITPFCGAHGKHGADKMMGIQDSFMIRTQKRTLPVRNKRDTTVYSYNHEQLRQV